MDRSSSPFAWLIEGRARCADGRWHFTRNGVSTCSSKARTEHRPSNLTNPYERQCAECHDDED